MSARVCQLSVCIASCYVNRYIFGGKICVNTIFTFPPLESLTFDLLTSKLFRQLGLLLTWITSVPSLTVVWLSVFELGLTVGTGQIDGRKTNGWVYSVIVLIDVFIHHEW